jgi:hypothetical protein
VAKLRIIRFLCTSTNSHYTTTVNALTIPRRSNVRHGLLFDRHATLESVCNLPPQSTCSTHVEVTRSSAAVTLTGTELSATCSLECTQVSICCSHENPTRTFIYPRPFPILCFFPLLTAQRRSVLRVTYISSRKHHTHHTTAWWGKLLCPYHASRPAPCYRPLHASAVLLPVPI